MDLDETCVGPVFILQAAQRMEIKKKHLHCVCNAEYNGAKTYKHHIEVAVGLRVVLFNLVLDFRNCHFMFSAINLFVLIK